MAETAFDEQLTTRLQHERIVVLAGEVNDDIANRITGQLLLLSAEDPHRDISLYINSPGGSVSAGMSIYDTMQFIPNDVSTLAMGFAASMGQFLLCAGAPGKRFSMPHARIVMHQALGGIGGSTSDIKIQAANLVFTKKLMQRLIAEHTGQDVETIDRDGDRDHWFTAEEARDYGIVDRVVSRADDVALVAQRRHVGL
ncbi:ATP-dependent Clp protease proteolytic subunit [Solicola gregarius]|uniref:ATP-dependent Clp protease proteolytic subunit n=1 Tax=Solicola gregarius TaxID=2908642 RepID=A0AA46YJU2_9ACTN|nr:ATP-dependent Clp protease proteolytic subunit [Solicola gregarius]UYM03358.1 ATP-dependent Clp protease proteolytic subunit [Solicola gregarius]